MKLISRISDPDVDVRTRDSFPFSETIAFWFAVSSPLTGLLLGLFGAWFVTWLTTWAAKPKASWKPWKKSSNQSFFW